MRNVDTNHIDPPQSIQAGFAGFKIANNKSSRGPFSLQIRSGRWAAIDKDGRLAMWLDHLDRSDFTV